MLCIKRCAHVYHLLIQQYGYVQCLVGLVDQVPTAEVEVAAYRLLWLVLGVLKFLEGTLILRVELVRHFSDVDAAGKQGHHLVGLVYFNS